MFPASFEYVRAKSLSEAAQFLNEHPDSAKVLAGGQSLIPLLKLRLAAPQYVLDIGRLPELQQIRETDGVLEIGALVRHAELERSDVLKRFCPLLPETAAEIGDIQVRNRGTLGGSLAHADPAGDFPAAALALEARLTATSVAGQRIIAAEDFFVTLMTTALRPNEILTSIQVPKLRPRTGSAYRKMHQPASGFAIVGVASVVSLDAAGKVEQVRVGITGVGLVPYRARRVEERLRGKLPTAQEIASASAEATEGTERVEPLSDMHASGEYRQELARLYTQRSLLKAVERAAKR
ncbi:MAG: xanthine dehydrogenase family protein subunit M [Acidobacteria bacterium]|nr:xanthine dehydrogenase family protein subunit M [Acidobacteriota bacterium]